MKEGNTVEFTATLKERYHLEHSFESNDNLYDICHFIDNTCARLQELKSSAIIKAISKDKSL